MELERDFYTNVISQFHVFPLLSFMLLLTYSMVQSPSWETNWFAASQEILRISRNPKVHYRTHKRPPPVLGQPNPVYTPTSHLLESHPNIIYLSTPRSSQWFLPSSFPSKTLFYVITGLYIKVPLSVLKVSIFLLRVFEYCYLSSYTDLQEHYSKNNIA